MMGRRRLSLSRASNCCGLGNGDFQKEDREKSSAPIELRERCNCEAKEDITAHFCLILPLLKSSFTFADVF